MNNDILSEIWELKLSFFGVFFLVCTITYGFLSVIDFLPEPVTVPPTEVVSEENVPSVTINSADPYTRTQTLISADTELVEIEPVVEIDPLPQKMIIDALDRELTILNPEESSVQALDAALLEGVVRHPDSADFTKEGTVFLFGHSSYLPTVFNKNFQAFNGIQNLGFGDTIRLQSNDREYLYRVDRSYEAKANDVEVVLVGDHSRLTLATCNSFGATDDRFVVEATFIESYTIENTL